MHGIESPSTLLTAVRIAHGDVRRIEVEPTSPTASSPVGGSQVSRARVRQDMHAIISAWHAVLLETADLPSYDKAAGCPAAGTYAEETLASIIDVSEMRRHERGP